MLNRHSLQIIKWELDLESKALRNGSCQKYNLGGSVYIWHWKLWPLHESIMGTNVSGSDKEKAQARGGAQLVGCLSCVNKALGLILSTI